MTKKNFDSMLDELAVLLADEQNGIISSTLKKDFDEAYQEFDLMTAWECFVDEVNRVDTVLELHDVLVDLPEECKKKINKIINDNSEI